MQQCFFCVYITARFHVKECIVKKQASRRNAEERTPLLHYAFFGEHSTARYVWLSSVTYNANYIWRLGIFRY